jgi:hypothetical protein
MPSGLQVYRVFHSDAVVPSSAADMDFTGFDCYRGEHRGAGGFSGPAARLLNHGEAFFMDAVRCVREGFLQVSSPFGGGQLASSDVLAWPATPWDTVPLYAFRFVDREPFYFFKRGLSWCTDIGLLFPRRSLLVSFQEEERRVAQDITDVEHAMRAFGERHETVAACLLAPSEKQRTCVILNSHHFGHHVWNELSALEGLVAAGLSESITVLANREPVAPIADLFPEIPRTSVVGLDGPAEEPMRIAMTQGLLAAPVGRRHVPQELIRRILKYAAGALPQVVAHVEEFRARHDFVLWATLRLEARTAVNLLDVLAASIRSLRQRHASLGVIIDGFTVPANVPKGWNEELIAAEVRAVPALLAAIGTPVEHVVLPGRPTLEALLWSQAADYYICPHGTAQHKVGWFNPVKGIVHVGDNKRPQVASDPCYHVLQRGALPRFVYGTVTRRDGIGDLRTDLLSYQLDPDAVVEALDADLTAVP